MPHPGKDKELKASVREQLERGVDPKEIAESTQLPLSLVRRWFRNLKRYGHMNNPSEGLPGNQRRFSQEMQTYLLGYLHARPEAQFVELRDVLREVYNQQVSISTLSRTLKARGYVKGHGKKRDAQTALTHGKDNTVLPASLPAVSAAWPSARRSPGVFTESIPGGTDLSDLQDSELRRIMCSNIEGTTSPRPANPSQTACPAPNNRTHHGSADNQIQNRPEQT